ncbi:MAG: DUF2625 domain-containing protein [Chitinophagaceae bacterium]|nr:DUF2625 domain-containing protein [Chitinophagaceae bacterium]
MKHSFLLILSVFYSLTGISQNKTRSIDELINRKEPGWTNVKKWIDSAKNKVEILPADTVKSKDALYNTQVTTRSAMGAIIFMTGGLLIDNGWIRILGSGNEKLTRSLPEWNKGKGFKEFVGEGAGFLLIADDAIGGFFLTNGGGLGKDIGKVYYFSPDNLKYEPLDMTYTDFLLFCFNNDLNKFYDGYRWANWKAEVSNLPGDKAFSFVPPLWSKQGKDFGKSMRSIVPIQEQYDLNLSFRKQLGLDQNVR